MRKVLLLLAVLVGAVPVFAQRVNTVYVDQYQGGTVGEKLTNAQNACLTGIPCVLVIDTDLAAYAEGVLPTRCINCIWEDYRSPSSGVKINNTIASSFPSSTGTPYFYGNVTPASGGLFVNNSSPLFTGWNDAMRGRIDGVVGGTFSGSGQTPFVAFNADARMQGNGQLVGYWASLKCFGIGNCMGANWVVQGWGGEGDSNGGHAISETVGLGEINMYVGSRNANESMFKATVTGSPASGATSISYTPVANEDKLGARRVYNVTRATVGNGTTVKITAISGNVIDFSGTNFTAADVGRYIAVGTTGALYAPTAGQCNGNDVPIDSVCVPDFDLITAVNSATEVVIENAYDTVGLVTAMPEPFLVVDGTEVTNFNTTSHTLTIKANSYAWANGDTLISPPGSHGEFLGANILMTPMYKRRGGGSPHSFFYGGSQGTQYVPMDSLLSGAGWYRYAIDLNGSQFVNPSRAINLPAQTALSWGTGTAAFLGGLGSEVYAANDSSDVSICNYINGHDTVNFDKVCMTSGGTYGELTLRKGGTGTAKPLYIWNESGGNVVLQQDKWNADTSGNLYPPAATNSTGTLGTPSNPIAALYATNTPVKVASGTAALGTSAIASGACATVVTVAATGAASTDVLSASFNGDVTGVTGYAPSASGVLSIFKWAGTNAVNFKVCNNTSASITPGAVSVNWIDMR